MGDQFDGDVGLRRTYLCRHEKTICPSGITVCRPLETSFRQLYNAFFLPELMLGKYALSAGFIAPSASLRRPFVDLRGLSVDLRGP